MNINWEVHNRFYCYPMNYAIFLEKAANSDDNEILMMGAWHLKNLCKENEELRKKIKSLEKE